VGFLQKLRGLVDPRLAQAIEDLELRRSGSAIWMDEEGLGVGEQGIRWSELQRIIAFKPNLLTMDLACLHLECADGTSIEVHETMAGWEELLDALPERVPGCFGVRTIVEAVAQGREAVAFERP
jgi:hypothetical protein